MANVSVSSSSSYSSAGDLLPEKSSASGNQSVQESEHQEALINKSLPRELLLRVFSFLDIVSLCRVAQVSRAWNELALDGSNWQFVDLFSFQRDINSALIQRLSSRTGGFLHALRLRGCRSLTDDALDQLARSCPNLQTLDLNDCKNLTDATCVSIAAHCTSLYHLNLSGLSITDASLHALATSSVLTSRLKHLDISFCLRLTASGFKHLLTAPAASYSNGFTPSHETTTGALSKPFRSVKPLSNISFFAAKMDSELATDSAIAQFAASAGPSLRTLLLNKCSHLTDEGVAAIGQHCTQLTTLALSYCHQLVSFDLWDNRLTLIPSHRPMLPSTHWHQERLTSRLWKLHPVLN